MGNQGGVVRGAGGVEQVVWAPGRPGQRGGEAARRVPGIPQTQVFGVARTAGALQACPYGARGKDGRGEEGSASLGKRGETERAARRGDRERGRQDYKLKKHHHHHHHSSSSP